MFKKLGLYFNFIFTTEKNQQLQFLTYRVQHTYQVHHHPVQRLLSDQQLLRVGFAGRTYYDLVTQSLVNCICIQSFELQLRYEKKLYPS